MSIGALFSKGDCSTGRGGQVSLHETHHCPIAIYWIAIGVEFCVQLAFRWRYNKDELAADFSYSERANAICDAFLGYFERDQTVGADFVDQFQNMLFS